jgi:hypothetical protein
MMINTVSLDQASEVSKAVLAENEDKAIVDSECCQKRATYLGEPEKSTSK